MQLALKSIETSGCVVVSYWSLVKSDESDGKFECVYKNTGTMQSQLLSQHGVG